MLEKLPLGIQSGTQESRNYWLYELAKAEAAHDSDRVSEIRGLLATRDSLN